MATYKPIIISSIDDIIECPQLMLYNSLESENQSLSDKNYKEVISKLKDSGDYLLIDKSEKNLYSYNRNNGKIVGFDNIVFLGKSGQILGFLVCDKTYGRDINYDIRIEVNKSVDKLITYTGILNVSLVSIEESISNMNNVFLGDNQNNYTNSKNILNDLRNQKPNSIYTPSIYDVEDNYNKLLTLSNRNTFSSFGYSHHNILFDTDVDIHDVKYDRFSVGYFMGDIVLNEWKELENDGISTNYYNIISLTRRNMFGNPISYLKRETNKKTSDGNLSGGYYLPKYEKSDEVKSMEIFYFSGKYAVGKILLSNGNFELRIFNTEGNSTQISGKWDYEFGENLEGCRLVLDELSRTPEIINLGKTKDVLNYGRVSGKLPEIVGNFNNFYSLLEKYPSSMEIIKKSGKWFLIKYKYQSSKIIYRYCGPYGDLILTESDIKNIIIIDSLHILYKSNNYYYYIHVTENTILKQPAH